MKQVITCCFIDLFPEDYFIGKEDMAPDYIKLRLELKNIIISLVNDFFVTHFISGMQLGLEQIFVELLIELKKSFSTIRVEGVIPYETQMTNWTERQQDKYYSIMQKIDKEMLLQCNYSYDCIEKGNMYMINKSKYIILYGNNINKAEEIDSYARSSGKLVIRLDEEFSNVLPRIKIYK